MDHAASICEECTKSLSVFQCIECEQLLCTNCDEILHKGGKRRAHKRVGLCDSCKSQASEYCVTCNQNLCRGCLIYHQNHTYSTIFSQNYVAIFWDLNSQQIVTGEEVSRTLMNLKNLYSRIDIFKIYGDTYFKWRNLFSNTLAEYSHPEGIRESEAILIDISLLNKDTVAEILLISAQAGNYKVHLNQIQSGLPKIKIYVSLTFPNIHKIPLSDLQTESKSYLLPPKISISKPLSGELQTQEKTLINQFPTYQNFPRKKGQNLSHDHLLTFLKELADSGQIMHESGWLCKIFAQRSRISVNESTNIIKEVQALGHIHTTERTFCDLKTTFFTSLKIDSLSFESLLWTLRSLKADEMLPTERAVQSRMKEGFEFKVSALEWSSLLEVCKGASKHTHTKSAPEQVTTNYSLFSSQTSGFTASPMFIVKEVTDPVTRQNIFVVYPKGEEWDSIDQYIKEGDVLAVKETDDWKAYVGFLTEYFSACEPGDASRAVPGGRYGCAQFLKYCGNQVLRNCSLGKLSYMVQLSIDEDLLRYHKTLLIWTPMNPKPVADTENNEKLAVIQAKILEVLKENKDGMSLAQLPLYVKRKLNFPLNISELGFAKLKDLLLTLPVVEIEQRGTNHPFAVYRGKRRLSELELKKLIEKNLQERSQGSSLQSLENLVSNKFGVIPWSDLKQANLLDFIRSKMPEIEIYKESNLLILRYRKQTNYLDPSKPIVSKLYQTNLSLYSSESLTKSYQSAPTHKFDYFDPFTSNPPGFN